jgi:hypothetical protein
MASLPKRPAPYIAALLLALLILLVLALQHLLRSPELEKAIERKIEERAKTPGAPPELDLPPPPPLPPRPAGAAPEVRELASRLNAPDSSIEEDLELLQEVFRLHARVHGGPPEGLNSDIAAHLTGANPLNAILFPPDHPALRDGELVDRWGSPFWFHPVSPALVEIRSAGPDKILFTEDDVLMNDTRVTEGAP